MCCRPSRRSWLYCLAPWIGLLLQVSNPSRSAQAASAASDVAETPVTHSFLATGAETRLVGENGANLWTYPHSTRDGWVLPNEHLLLTLSKDDQDYKGGGVIELDRAGKVYLEFKGTQSEINTAQRLPNGNTLLTEAGPKPRLLEISSEGKVLVEFPIQCQLTNFHMQSRMSRKLANGHYLIPQLFDKVVREYSADGSMVWEAKTPHWPFTAIRLENGHTLVNCTYGNTTLEIDGNGASVWQLQNSDLPEPFIKDACGAQRLPNGNTVLTSYGIGTRHTKLIEVTPDKKVVWRYTDASPHGIHHFQILTTNGKPIEGRPLR